MPLNQQGVALPAAPRYLRPPSISTFRRLGEAERIIPLALFLLSFLYLCLFRRYTTMEPDEGIILQGAQRILQGQVLYRDFFSFYTPASYYLLALLFRIFGNSFLAARTALALEGAIFSLVTYHLARRVCSRSIALMMAALTTFTALPYRFLVLHNWDSTLWACLSIYAAVRVLTTTTTSTSRTAKQAAVRPVWNWAMAAGAFAALTTLSEQSKGAGLCLGIAVGFLALKFFSRNSESISPISLKISLNFVCGFFVPFAITLAYFATRHAVGTMLSDWLWPLRNYSAANHVPYGYQNWSDNARHLIFCRGTLLERVVKIIVVSPCFWIPALPPIALIWLGYHLTKASSAKISDEKTAYYVVVPCAYLGLVLSVVITRPDIIHFMYLQPLNCLIVAWLLDDREFRSGLFDSARPWLIAYVGVSLVAFGLAPLALAASAPKLLSTRRGVVTTREQDSVVAYLVKHVPEGSTVLIYPYLPLYYYLSGTVAPGPYDYFQPGMHTPRQAEEVLTELASGPADAVLFEPNFPDKFAHSWPGTPLAAIANDPVADYIVRNYRSCNVLTSPSQWRFLFMVRKNVACP